MNLGEWIVRMKTNFQNEGLTGLVDSMYEVYCFLLRNIVRPFARSGTPVYEREWDVLILLDGCRFDTMKSMAHDYEFLQNVDSSVSVGSMSAEWMNNNFSAEFDGHMRETAYVTGNPFSEQLVDGSDFEVLDEVWKYAWDEDIGTIHPRPVTDRAIEVYRDQSPKYLIVHYMQPHYPFVDHPELGSRIERPEANRRVPEAEGNIWKKLRHGRVSTETVKQAYEKNLRYVLDDVAVLLKSIDADSVVISADHGNAFGELGVYGHPGKMKLNSIVRVPWCRTSARDTGEYRPTTYERYIDGDVEDRLSSLGYK